MMPLVEAGDVRRSTGPRWSVALDLDEFQPGRPALDWAARGGQSRATLDTSARSTREDGGAPWTVPSESTPRGCRRRGPTGAVGPRAAAAAARPRRSCCCSSADLRSVRTCARSRHARRRAGPGRRRSRVRVRFAGYEIGLGLFSEEAGRRAAAADSPQSGSPTRPVPTVTTRKPTASTWPAEDRSTTPHSPAPQARIERSRTRSSSPAGPDSPDSPNRAQSAN
jgi:hypothetical protein